MTDSIETIVIMGPPGSGKDTQAEFLVDALGYQIISTGELMRILAGHNEKIREMMAHGDLIPDSVVEDELISAFILLPENQPVILDGYPRTVEQADKLERILEKNNRKLDKLIYLKVDDDEVVKRISKRRICSRCGRLTSADEGESCIECGGKLTQREDDKPASIKERLRVFHGKTEPIINYFEEKGTLALVDGNPAPEAVREEIRKAL